jgi:signal transduction histidine kinase
MSTAGVPAASTRREPVEVALAALLGVLVIFAALVAAVPSVRPALVDDRLDTAISTMAAVIALSVAWISWLRVRETGERGALLRAAAFLVLGTYNAVTVLVGLADAERAVGSSLAEPGQLPVLAGIVARAAAALLLVLAGLAGTRRVTWSRAGSLARFVVPAASFLVLAALGVAVQGSLPALIGPDALAQLATDPTAPLPPSDNPWLLLAQLGVAVAFLYAALLSYRLWRQERRLSDAWLATGLVIAAFSQFHAGIHPGAYTSLVTTADLLRIGFYLALLLGMAAERRADVQALRAANVELVRLREVDATRAALEERGRLAREIHDGLSQDLWYAKLKQSRLTQLTTLTDEQARLADEVTDAIDAALAEARQAVMAMRATSEDATLIDVLQRYVDDFADRFGLRAVLERDGDVPSLSPRAQAEVLRIVQEALNNVRKHADATVVRVRVTGRDEAVRVVVADNGRGFDPERADAPGFGMESMRQRAALLGGTLEVDARPRDGTRLSWTVPVKQPPTP